MEAVKITNLTFTYPQSSVAALKNISLSVEDGELFVICGRSGCGKSTLLRQLKPSLSPHGEKKGIVFFFSSDINTISARDAAAQIGFVMQSPENQIVTDTVRHELAFGLESLGTDNSTIRRRVSETASFFGIEGWINKPVCELSGGQKQILNLASVILLRPRLLILDEPTAQLDPIAASDFLSLVHKINRELGTTVIMSEHRLEQAFSIATHAAVFENGELLCCNTPCEIGTFLKKNKNSMFAAMPSAMRIWASVESELFCPISVREGREFLKKYTENSKITPIEPISETQFGNIRIFADDIWFRYKKELPDTVKGLNLSVKKGEIYSLLGSNGAGKSTVLKLLAGIEKPYRGKISASGKICLLPQNPQTLFIKNTVADELSDAAKISGSCDIDKVMDFCILHGLEQRHPFDLSGGEQQRLALAKLLLFKPDILLLDEPTKGLDADFRTQLGQLLKALAGGGLAILIVSHDLEFCAQYASKCALFFDGAITVCEQTRTFFSGNSFYTTSANRIARNIINDAVTVDDVITAIGGKVEKVVLPKQKINIQYEKKEIPVEKKKLPLWRKICAAVSALGAVGVLIYATQIVNISALIGTEGATPLGQSQIPIYAALIFFLVLAAVFIGKKSEKPIQTPKEKRRLSRRTILAVCIVLFMVPLTLFIGISLLEKKQYYLTALAVLVECIIPFFAVFEGRHPKARELVVIAVLCALGIAGRAAFIMLPQFKPVLALTIIAGVALGGETGFLVGSVTMLVSNMLFSQGPWTPWQMFAMGLCGFLAGIFFRKGFLRRSKTSLCIFGALCAVVVYGGIMNPSTAFIWGSESLNMNMILGYYIAGFPLDCIHAVSTAIFLWLAAEPMLGKLDRLKTKYGINE